MARSCMFDELITRLSSASSGDAFLWMHDRGKW
jgi:hypothetical protein